VFFDLQVNGYAGIDFNRDDVTPEDLHRACERLDADGIEACLIAIITDTIDAMCRRLSALAAMRDRDPLAIRVIAGFHVEGPFISPADGYRLLTGHGVIVSAGHTDASLELLRGALDAGVSMFTHLGNGCPMMMHRHDNIVQRVLSLSDRVRVSFIADGAHVPFVALRNYLRLLPLDRCAVVTDCIASAGLGPGRYTLGRWDIVVGDDMVPRSPDGSHFVGSGVTMRHSAQNLLEHVHLPEDAVRRLTYDNPKAFLHIN
jgi:N-acetylglucosamine-6-phosphate deacetylase